MRLPTIDSGIGVGDPYLNLAKGGPTDPSCETNPLTGERPGTTGKGRRTRGVGRGVNNRQSCVINLYTVRTISNGGRGSTLTGEPAQINFRTNYSTSLGWAYLHRAGEGGDT